MGFLGIGNYSKPGKGVSKDTPEKKRFFLFWEIFFRKFWKIIQANLLYVLCFVPFVFSFVLLIMWGSNSTFGIVISVIALTISAGIGGTATAGITYIMRSYAKEQHAFLVSDFVDAIKNNWKQASITGILQALGGIIVYYSSSFYYANIQNFNIHVVLFGISLLLGILLLFSSYYVYLLMVTIDLKLVPLLKNALIMSILGLRTNLITTFFVALIIVPTVLLLPYTVVLVVLIVPAWIQLILSFNSYQYVKKYCIDPYYANQEESDSNDKLKSESVFSDDIITGK